MLAKVILDAIEQLEIYTTNKVQEWKEIKEKADNSAEQNRVATAVWETYRDMANRIADLGELAEKVIDEYKKAFKPMEWQYSYDKDCYYCPCCRRLISYGHKNDCKLKEFMCEKGE